ncbi:MAG: hypothetical protein RMM31_02940 [Anaerolineae bacterium]|nr:hypothetical protein [Thermoflexales bacterium]MDW8395180.1 hypothetical protein [Anaerolineae bacterium]
MSNPIELLRRLSEVATPTLVLLLAAAAGVTVLVHNWRIALPATAAHFVLAGALLSQVLDPTVAFIKPLAGVVACLGVALAAFQADQMRQRIGQSIALERLRRPNWLQLPSQLLLRMIVAALVLVTALNAAARFPIPTSAPGLVAAAYVLAGFGLALIATSFEAMNIGLGILLLLSAFELAFTPLEPSIGVSVLLAVVTLMVGLAVSVLTLADVEPTDEPSQATLAEASLTADAEVG